MDPLLLPSDARAALWRALTESIEQYLETIPDRPVAAPPDPARLERWLEAFEADAPHAPDEAVRRLARVLSENQVNTPHPRYFGLFNPASTTMGIAADALVAALNPQLAAYSHSPFAVAVETRLVREIAALFGLPASSDGTFTSGGAEANHTGLLCALLRAFPEVATRGVRACAGAPTLYCSDGAHDSVVKAARVSGLGDDAVRRVPLDASLRMDVAAARRLVEDDRASGRLPFLLVGTAGTTAAGVIDPLPALADLAREHRLWLHVDAAWGGAAMLSPELRPALDGIERADSITFDAHKWLSVPMAAGMLLTRHPDVLSRTFAVSAAYMPPPGTVEVVPPDPFAHSLGWSRRFIGLKLFLTLAVHGWDGYRALVERQTALGQEMRAKITEAGFRIVNRTPLPLVCFTDAEARPASWHRAMADRVVDSGKAWISTVSLAGQPALRACITSHRTEAADLDALVAACVDARSALEEPAAPGGARAPGGRRRS